MEQFKFSLGPYELFASIIGGLPLSLAMYLMINPTLGIGKAIETLPKSFSVQTAILLATLSYILGGVIQGITWRYFLFLCKAFRQDYHYFKDLQARIKFIEDLGENINTKTLDFEDKLILLLRQKIGIPQKIDWIIPRLTSYLKEHNRPSAITGESMMASHIMYRNISFGLLILDLTVLFNLFSTRTFVIEGLVFILLSTALAYMAFFRSLSFKRWHEREIIFGFYFATAEN